MIECTLREHSIVMNKSRKRNKVSLSAFLFFIHYSYDIIPEPAFFIRFFFTTSLFPPDNPVSHATVFHTLES